MNFHEYQAKQLFADYGIAVPAGRVARSPEEAELQASGKSIAELAAEAEAEAEFEIANLFDEMGAAQDGEDLTRD